MDGAAKTLIGVCSQEQGTSQDERRSGEMLFLIAVSPLSYPGSSYSNDTSY